MEHRCQFDECGKKIYVPYSCAECGGIFCQVHVTIENHECLNPKRNYKNKNNKSKSTTITEINDEIESFELSDNEIIQCRFEECNQTSDYSIFLKCNTCKRSYCSKHRNMDEHNCTNIKFTLKEIAINTHGYWECKKCNFVNAPTTKTCMVCQLNSYSNTDEIENESVCPYCRKLVPDALYEIHLKICENKMVKRMRNNTNDSVLDEIVCPYCKKSVCQYVFDYHIDKCIKNGKNNDNHDDVDMASADKGDGVTLYCDQCDKYISYKVYDFHMQWCKGKTKSKVKVKSDKNEMNNGYGEFCPVCKELIFEQYDQHLEECYNKEEAKYKKEKKKENKKEKCPFCKQMIDGPKYTNHLSFCSHNVDTKNKHKKVKKQAKFVGIRSAHMRSTKYKTNKGNIKGRFTRNHGNTPKHLWRQTTLDNPRKRPRNRTKYKSKLNNVAVDNDNNEPKYKRRKIDEMEQKRLRDNEPYHKQTLLWLKDLSKHNGNNDMDIDIDANNTQKIKCYWRMPAQHMYKENVFKIMENNYDMLKSDATDLNGEMIDFFLKYIYCQWLSIFKKKVYIFSCAFFDMEMDNNKKNENDMIYFDFLFEKEFIIIPKWNEYSTCWEIIIICHVQNIKSKKGAKKPCIVIWDVVQEHKKGKTKTNKVIRKWLDLQYKHKYNIQNKEDMIFTTNTMKAFVTVKIPKLLQNSHYESAWYQLLNFKKFGIMAGYQNTISKAKLHEITFGFKQVKQYQKELISVIDNLHKSQQPFL